MIAAVVLAAGASRRLGRPKQTAVLGGETLVERAVRVAQNAGLSPVIVVINASADFVEFLRIRGCVVVWNDQADEGIASSIRAGIGALKAMGVEGAVVMTCDQVAITAEHLQALCEVPQRVTASEYDGRKGVPAYFPVGVFGELMVLQGDVGARELLRKARVVLDESLALDIDTEEDFAEARAIFERQLLR